jgi:hypothetical protein
MLHRFDGIYPQAAIVVKPNNPVNQVMKKILFNG